MIRSLSPPFSSSQVPCASAIAAARRAETSSTPSVSKASGVASSEGFHRVELTTPKEKKLSIETRDGYYGGQ
jgi:hypothetical protein